MSLLTFAAERALALADRGVSGAPFDPATSMAAPGGRRRSWAHYGVMVPGLPDPHRYFNLMALLGTPGIGLFANDALVTTTPNDTAYVVSATSAMIGGQFAAYRMGADCDIAPDGSSLRFGSDVQFAGRYPNFAVTRRHPEVRADLRIAATDRVARFFDIPGVYRHWSLLARAVGRVETRESIIEFDRLCTVEYAAGVGVHAVADRLLPPWLRVPARQFTYHVLDVDDRTQLLFTQVVGPGAMRLRSAVYERSLDSYGNVLTFGHVWAIHEHEPQPLVTPDGRSMRMPKRFSWRVADDDRHEAVRVDGHAHGDWAYGIGAGYCGSYEYTGNYRGRDIEGVAYIEYIDLGE